MRSFFGFLSIFCCYCFADSIHDVAKDGDLTEIENLVEQGIPIDLKDDRFYGATPLHLAALEGHIEIGKYLIETRL